MIDQDTSTLLETVIEWFNERADIDVAASGGINIGQGRETIKPWVDEIRSTIRRLCDGDADAATSLVDDYLTKAVDDLADHHAGGIQHVQDASLLNGWTGTAAYNFKSVYLPAMCDAVDNQINIAEGIATTMAGFASLVAKNKADAYNFLHTVRDRQLQVDAVALGQGANYVLTIVGCVTGSIGPIGELMEFKSLTVLDELTKVAKNISDAVSATITISGSSSGELMDDTLANEPFRVTCRHSG